MPFEIHNNMLLKELGSEFSFIERIRCASEDARVILPNGDDAAVFERSGSFVAVSTDTIVEGDHFSRAYFKPEQIGIKAIESSVSDIVAVGARPSYVFLSLVIPDDMTVECMDGVYAGINQAAKRCAVSVLGGDTTHGATFVISVTVLGDLKTLDNLCPRHGAKPGDLVYITGPLGGAMAGLKLLRARTAGFDDVKRLHLEPRCRVDLLDALAPYATSMIDISDGLSSEIHHICKASACGAIIEESLVPQLPRVREVAKHFGDNPLDYAYSGGEDFELLYTIDPSEEKHAVGTKIGTITPSGVMLRRAGELIEFQNRGYDHFKNQN